MNGKIRVAAGFVLFMDKNVKNLKMAAKNINIEQ